MKKNSVLTTAGLILLSLTAVVSSVRAQNFIAEPEADFRTAEMKKRVFTENPVAAESRTGKNVGMLKSVDFIPATVKNARPTNDGQFPLIDIDNEAQFPVDESESTAAKSAISKRQTAGYTRPTRGERGRRYVNRAFGPFAFLGAGIGATFQQIGDSPEEWENNGKGFARRFASNFARNAIEETVVYGLDEAFSVDSTFYRKGKSASNGKRIANALLSVVTARRASGKRVVGVPRLVGIFSSNVIAFETWFPDRFNYRDGLRNGSVSLGFNAVFNLLREFVFSRK